MGGKYSMGKLDFRFNLFGIKLYFGLNFFKPSLSVHFFCYSIENASKLRSSFNSPECYRIYSRDLSSLFLFFLWKIFTSACDISPIIVRAWRLLQAFASCKPWNAKNKDDILPFSSALRKEITLRLGFKVWQVKLWQLYSTNLTSLGCGKTLNVTFMKQGIEFHWPETSWCRYVVKSHMYKLQLDVNQLKPFSWNIYAISTPSVHISTFRNELSSANSPVTTIYSVGESYLMGRDWKCISKNVSRSWMLCCCCIVAEVDAFWP